MFLEGNSDFLEGQANYHLGENGGIEEDLGPHIEVPTLILFCFSVFSMFEEKFWNVFLLVRFLVYAIDTDFSVPST
jgi:hypothetical protein